MFAHINYAWGLAMVDCVEARKNLEKLESDLYHLQQLNQLNSRYAFKRECRDRMSELNEQIKSIEWQLSQPAKTR